MSQASKSVSSKRKSNKDSSDLPKTKKIREDSIPFARGFKVPSKSAQIKAIGCDPLTPEYDPVDETFFPSIPHPTSIDDWLAMYNEDGQTYQLFLKECPWLSTRKRKYMHQTFHLERPTIVEKYPDGKIYLLPLGSFKDGDAVDFGDLIDYTETFLGIPTLALPGVKVEVEQGCINWIEEPRVIVPDKTGKSRRTSMRVKTHTLESRYDSDTNNIQLCVNEGLVRLKSYIPDDALCVIGLTMFDLYSDETDLFVAGMAAGNHKVAIFSFKRYNPCLTFSQEFWYDIRSSRDVPEKEKKRLILQRSCKLLVHEISHLLGIDHCIYYDCCMNGSGHLTEDFRQPMHLCPVDLHKLQTLVGFDVLGRYEKLYDFYLDHDLGTEAKWIKKRVTFLQSRLKE